MDWSGYSYTCSYMFSHSSVINQYLFYTHMLAYNLNQFLTWVKLGVMKLFGEAIACTVTLKTESYHDGNFDAADGTVGCHGDNLRYHQWRQSWDYDIYLVSVNAWWEKLPWPCLVLLSMPVKLKMKLRFVVPSLFFCHDLLLDVILDLYQSLIKVNAPYRVSKIFRLLYIHPGRVF